MCAALKVTRQGYYTWKSRPPSTHALRDEELAVAISQVRDEVRGIYGAPKTFMRLRALGVRTSRKRAARIMRERGWRGVTRACAKRLSDEEREFGTMRGNGIRPSMGPISSPRDNAATESPMGIVRSECAHARACAAREGAAPDLSEYIEAIYNRARTHSALGYLSPAEFEEANWPKENSRPKAA